MGLAHKISERPSGAPVATGVTSATGVHGILGIYPACQIDLKEWYSSQALGYQKRLFKGNMMTKDTAYCTCICLLCVRYWDFW